MPHFTKVGCVELTRSGKTKYVYHFGQQMIAWLIIGQKPISMSDEGGLWMALRNSESVTIAEVLITERDLMNSETRYGPINQGMKHLAAQSGISLSALSEMVQRHEDFAQIRRFVSMTMGEQYKPAPKQPEEEEKKETTVVDLSDTSNVWERFLFNLGLGLTDAGRSANLARACIVREDKK